MSKDMWKLRGYYVLLLLGMVVLIFTLALWVVSLGYIKVASPWCGVLDRLETGAQALRQKVLMPE